LRRTFWLVSGQVVLCVDVGSTFTKACAVDLATGRLLGTAEHPTTIGGRPVGRKPAETLGWAQADVMAGISALRAALAGVAPHAEMLVCSSAGGGLRLAVVGYEREISAEAGHRVALSAGARVVHVSAGRLDEAGVASLVEAAADLVLLVGGTDGGEASVLLHNAAALASAGLGVPVVVAGNAVVRTEVCALLAAAGVTAVPADNVLPDIGELDPESARTAIRGVFLEHVIGGKGLSADPNFAGLVRAVTPDAVLSGVSVLAEQIRSEPGRLGSGSVVVVDVGGATTDVYCVLSPDAEQAMLGREAVGVPSHRRTVEGDLGLRWTADALLAAAESERLVSAAEAESFVAWAAARSEVVGPPESELDRANELRLAGLAVMIAIRRHVRAESAYGVTGTAGASARSAGTVILSGGAIRHASPAERADLVDSVLADRGGARGVLLGADVRCDSQYVLAAAGLLAAEFPAAAAGLVRASGLVD